MNGYGAYLTTDKLIAIELPTRHHDTARHNREVSKARADLLCINLRHYIDSTGHRPEERWVLEKAVEGLRKQSE